ncbi:MAG: hypothetical protein ACTSRP_07760 [Candidatus Helarchaeota archaeon]
MDHFFNGTIDGGSIFSDTGEIGVNLVEGEGFIRGEKGFKDMESGLVNDGYDIIDVKFTNIGCIFNSSESGGSGGILGGDES